MPSPPPFERLLHIRDEAQYLLRVRPRFANQDDLEADEDISRAVVRALEIIGEATKNVPATWRSSYPQIEWRQIAKMRDRLTHHYFDTDFEVVWEVLENEIKPLLTTIEQMIRELAPDGPA
jgi:uncharacterized protein with HEPN domain